MRKPVAALLLSCSLGAIVLAATSLPTVEVKNHAPLVSLRLVFAAGAALDPPGKAGLACLTANLIAAGGTRTMSYRETVDRLYPTAASVSCQVDKDMTVFYGTSHRDTLDRYYAVLQDKLLHPGFRPDDFDRVRSDIVNSLSIDLRGNNDEELGKEALYSFIYLGHPYGHPNLGLVHTLQHLARADVERFYKSYYTRPRVVLGLAGCYTPAFKQRVQHDLDSLPDGVVARQSLPTPPPIHGLQVQMIQKDARATAMSLGFPIAVRRGDPDFPALWLATSWLGEHRSDNSHLYQRLREVRGLNYGDYAYIEYFPNGMFTYHVAPNLARRQQIFQMWIRPVERPNAHFALRAALYEYRKLIAQGMTEEDFNNTREYLSKYVYVGMQSQDAQLGYALDSQYYGMGDFAETMRHAMSTMTRQDVNRVIRKYWSPSNIKIVVVAGNCQELAAALSSDAPSPIHYDAPKPPDVLKEDVVIAHLPLHIQTKDITIVPVDKVFE